MKKFLKSKNGFLSNLDSLTMVEVIITLNETFNVQLIGTDVIECKSFEDLTTLIVDFQSSNI